MTAINPHVPGLFDAAETDVDRIYGIDANSFEAMLLTGILDKDAAKVKIAIEQYCLSNQSNRNQSVSPLSVGKLLCRAGFTAEAVSVLRKSVRFKPDDADAWLLLSHALEVQGHLDEALHQLRKAHQCCGDNPFIINFIGVLYQKKGRAEPALKAFQRAIALAPEFAEAYHNLSIIFRERGKLKHALDCCRKALSIQPEYAEALNHAGIIRAQLGHSEEALRCYRKAIETNPGYADAHYNLGNLLRKMGHYKQALDAYKTAVQHDQSMYRAFNNMGSLYMVLGDAPAALGALESAVNLKPDFVQAWRNIATMRHFESRDRFVEGMERLVSTGHLDKDDEIHLNFALSKVYEDLKDHDRAFHFMASGNRSKRKTFAYDKKVNTRLFAAIRNVFDRTFMDRHLACGFKDPTPIFILGMPRSGTTLVEQILQAHPNVFGGGEISSLDAILSSISQAHEKGAFPGFVHELKDLDFETIGMAYVKAIRELSPLATYITDKMPQNFLFVGMIRLILPNAKIIHCVRHPMDTCLSIYKTLFTTLHPYAYDLDEIGHYYRLYSDLMHHWHQVLSKPVYEISYESLVLHPERHIRHLLSHCELDWNPRCMKFHQSNRPVLTASTMQVRRPVYSDSVSLWKKYRRQLSRLRSRLGVVCDQAGIENQDAVK